MELISIVGVVMLSVGLSLAGARAMLAAGLFLMTRKNIGNPAITNVPRD